MGEQMNWKQLEEKIGLAVKVSRRPVAVSFLDAPPLGVEKFDGTEPSGCSFWRLAADGRVFYTVPESHRFGGSELALLWADLLSRTRRFTTPPSNKNTIGASLVRILTLP